MRSNIDNLILENKKLKKIIEKLETKLQKYTNPEINKKYYHNIITIYIYKWKNSSHIQTPRVIKYYLK